MNEPWMSPLAGEARLPRPRAWLSARRALGDALGYPIEFSTLDRIRAANGDRGVTGLLFAGDSDVARISDDTQMALFTAEALIQAHRRERLKGIGGAWPLLVRWAYERWLETQRHPGPEHAAPPQSGAPEGGLIDQAWLYARRAPGNACVSGVAWGYPLWGSTPLTRRSPSTAGPARSIPTPRAAAP